MILQIQVQAQCAMLALFYLSAGPICNRKSSDLGLGVRPSPRSREG
jgi:hypothetical protein